MKTMRKPAAAWRRHLTIGFLFAACLAMMFGRTAFADEVATTSSDGAAAKSAHKDSADGKSKPAAAASENLGQRKQGDVTESEKLGYRESKVAAEMTELEERMYRLSEALKRLEPENSSRLMSGVKYARTELIQHEMHEIEQILTKSDYKLASGSRKRTARQARAAGANAVVDRSRFANAIAKAEGDPRYFAPARFGNQSRG